ncbi:tripartite tricarboxylate transporter TctB family protein [Neorhizobium sp. LjRoot104]|uniref:tripartite tricarboxylate transporter TctB family protein n=1 Tax=Neorhizobium sp. LjRoot104 TaxID=3342254 RepID=UPI003ECCC9C9
MSESSSNPHRLTGRISALCLLVLAIAYGVGGGMIEYAFASDPLGPRVMPILLAGVLGALSLFYLRFPGSSEKFPKGSLLYRVLAIPVLLIISVMLFEPAGFAISIFVLTFGTALLFGANRKMSLLGGLGHAALWWVIFSYLLEVYLPVGAIFG